MTDTDRLRLARLVQFRELITLIFRDPTPWGESLPVQVLADFLESEGAHDVADAVRGRFVFEWGELQATSWTIEAYETYRKMNYSFLMLPLRTDGDYKRKERPKD